MDNFLHTTFFSWHFMLKRGNCFAHFKMPSAEFASGMQMLKSWTKFSIQTMWTQIGLLLGEQSNLGQYCLLQRRYKWTNRRHNRRYSAAISDHRAKQSLLLISEPRHVIINNVAFGQVYTQTSLCSLLLSLETPNDVQSVASQSWNVQATCKGSGQTARMRRLTWGFAGRTYHIVGSLMSHDVQRC